jgi:hypothetical protein
MVEVLSSPGPEANRKRAKAAQEDARLSGWSIVEQLDGGQALRESAEDDLALQPGQPGAQAVVDAPAETDRVIVGPADAETLRVAEAIGVAVGPADDREDEVAWLHDPAADLDRLEDVAAV